MKVPARLVPLLDMGIIDRVIRPLQSGKEARVYLVQAGDERRAAKVYKDVSRRSFKHKSSYTEARKVRNSRDARAMKKRSKYGRERDEEVWNSAEADTIFKLWHAGVRVPKPHVFIDGVLVMDCVEGPDASVAPRIAECDFTRDEAQEVFDAIIRQIVGMMCVDIVHADLSVYNILYDGTQPVIIDFPQSISAPGNPGARDILLRDVANITSQFRLGRPLERLRFGHEIWDLYERGALTPDATLTGEFDLPQHEIDAERLLAEMLQIEEDEVLDAQEYDDF